MPSSKVLLPPPPRAAELLCANEPEKKLYWDRSHYDSPESQMRALAKSKTLYIGNIAFSTRASHLRALFSTLGPVAAIHIGKDRYRKTPCGFAFVEYESRSHAQQAVAYLTGTKLDGRVIRVELDAGFKPGREYGRGVSGGQVRDDRRGTPRDPARSGANSRGGGGGGGGFNNARWQAPNAPQNNNDHYGPSAGNKRSREDDMMNDDIQQPPAKNSRFREDGSDDEL